MEKNNRKYTIENLEELLDKIPYEMWIKDSEGRHQYINKISAERMGLKKEDVIGKTDYDFRPKEMAESCMEGDRAVLSTGEDVLVEDKIEVSDTEEKWYEIFKTVLNGNGDEKLIGGVARYTSINKNESDGILETYLDIANSSAVEESDKNLNILNKLKEMINADDIALYLYDDSSRKMSLEGCLGEKKVIFAQKYILDDESFNKYFTINTYIAKEELSNKSVNYVYSIKNKNKLVGALHIYFKNDKTEIEEEIIKYTCIMLSFIYENINLENNLKKELKKRKQVQNKLEAVLNTGIDIYALIQKNENGFKCIEASKKCDELIGTNFEEFDLKEILKFIDIENEEKLCRCIYDEQTDEMDNLCIKLFCKDGKYRTLNINWRCIEDNLYVLTGKDVTNLYKLRQDKKDLQQAIEMEGLKTEFFANISHEFKTPLNIILSAVQVILSSEDNKNSKFTNYIKSIKQNSYRLLKLANNMIDLTKIDDGFYDMNIDNYNIVEVVENIVQSLASYIKNSERNIVFDTQEEEIITACDPDQIEKIVLNILSNSVKFTSCNGNIYVNMEISKDCRKVIIRIRNDGPIISKEDAEKIFGRFTQSENLLTRSVEGTGIGLALVKSLVELHNGSVYVNTKVEYGTEFCIELPIRKLMNCKSKNIPVKSLNSKVEKFNIEFSDIYDLN